MCLYNSDLKQIEDWFSCSMKILSDQEITFLLITCSLFQSLVSLDTE